MKKKIYLGSLVIRILHKNTKYGKWRPKWNETKNEIM